MTLNSARRRTFIVKNSGTSWRTMKNICKFLNFTEQRFRLFRPKKRKIPENRPQQRGYTVHGIRYTVNPSNIGYYTGYVCVKVFRFTERTNGPSTLFHSFPSLIFPHHDLKEHNLKPYQIILNHIKFFWISIEFTELISNRSGSGVGFGVFDTDSVEFDTDSAKFDNFQYNLIIFSKIWYTIK